MRLQCLVEVLGDPAGLRAHRALDDSVALRHVAVALAEQVGLDLPLWLQRFAWELDLRSNLLQLDVLLDACRNTARSIPLLRAMPGRARDPGACPNTFGR